MNQHFLEKNQIVSGFLPIAMNAGANAGDYISMKNYSRCAIVFFKSPGTAGDDPVITLLQATTVAGAGAKAVNITRVHKKQAATNLLSTGTFVESTAAAPAALDTFSTNTWTNSALAEQAAIVVLDVKADDLDIKNNFDCISASVADIGTNAQLGSLFYILHEPKYGDPMPSPIID